MTDARAAGQRDEADAGRAEAASAGQILQMLVKAARGFVIYLPNNPLHDKFLEDLRARLDEHLEEHGALRLAVEHDAFRLAEAVVYTNPELRENLAFRLYADGVRAISLEEGIEPEELRTLVEILSRPSGEDEEDDVVTRLWAAELPHVHYVLADLPPAAGPEALGAPPPGTVQAAALRGVAAAIQDLPTPPPRSCRPRRSSRSPRRSSGRSRSASRRTWPAPPSRTSRSSSMRCSPARPTRRSSRTSPA